MTKLKEGCFKKKRVRIIECDTLQISTKDVIPILNWRDFIWLLSDDKCVYKSHNTYYIVAPDVVWIYTLKHEQKNKNDIMEVKSNAK